MTCTAQFAAGFGIALAFAVLAWAELRLIGR